MPLIIKSKLLTAISNLVHTQLQPESVETSEPALSRDNKIIPVEFEVERKNYIKGKPISRDELIKAIHIASVMDKSIEFQAFNSYHKQLLKPLVKVLFRIHHENLNEAIDYARKYVNKSLLNYALSIIFRHRPDMQEAKVLVPSHVTVAPHLYFDMGNLDVAGIDENRMVVLTGKFDYDDHSIHLEHRVDYFRCDPGINAHHRHWHEAYPDTSGFDGDQDRDRSGELFYYMHSQMVSRYNFERLSVDVPFAKPITNLREPLPEPYFNRLKSQNQAKLWDSRPPNQLLTDLNVNGMKTKIQDLELARSRIYEAIDRGYVYVRNKDGTETLKPLNPQYDKHDDIGIPIDEGIDTLGNMMLASSKLSINFRYYGDLHNDAHMVIGYSHDPQGLYYKQSNGSAMTMTETASRDPAFFRWHTFVDDTFERYKATLPPYRTNELEFEGIKINTFDVVGSEKNVFKTKWVKDRVDITEGIPKEKRNFLNINKVYYDFIHLGHEEFEYQISVHNDLHAAVQGVVRIFMAPCYTDQDYKEMLYRMGKEAMENAKERNPHLEPSFNKLRRMFIELDKFTVTLRHGNNQIRRCSKSSSVTVPFKQMFMTLEEANKYTNDSKEAQQILAWCGCGWPDYLLIGKGTKEGLPCHLFVMISDYEKDKIPDSLMDNQCPTGSMSYCGILNKKYPDLKPMGYPFDRNIESEELLLADFMTKTRDPKEIHPELIDNMKVTDVVVRFNPCEIEDGPTIMEFTPPSAC